MLIIEDDENLSRGIAFAFEKEGFAVVCVGTLGLAIKAFHQNDFDIVILDLGLPDGDGVEFCRMVREKSSIPIVMLTARDLETDEVQGLVAGADDYVTKPFSLSVLRARVDAVLRRHDRADGHIIQSNGYWLDTKQCKLYRNETEILISTTEFRLLCYLMSNAGQILTKEQIFAATWDNQGNFVDENALSVNISRLRAKIEENPKTPSIIKTIRGMGYTWVKG
jgi:DNA-binding response OmpR family regulator